MSYLLYVTRRKRWHDEDGPAITLSEWVALVESDPELSFEPSLGEHYAVWSGGSSREVPYILWDSGNLESKHPDDDLVEKMIQLASMLGARVVGEEGELYVGVQSVLPAPAPSLLERLKSTLYAVRVALSSQAEATNCEFEVGSRVKGFQGKHGTVTWIDLKAERGLGVITVKYDDGRIEQYSAIAHGLEALEGDV